MKMKKTKPFPYGGICILGLCIAILQIMLYMNVINASAASDAPSKITGVTQNGGDYDRVEIEWMYADNNHAEYQVAISEDGVKWKRYKTRNNYITITRRDAGKAYRIKVRGYTCEYDTEKGSWVYSYGPYSKTITAVTAPGKKVANFRQTNQTTTSAKIRWDAVKGATGYQITYGQKSTWKKKPETKTTVYTKKTALTISGLHKDTGYFVEITPYKDGTYRAKSDKMMIKTEINPLPTKTEGIQCNRILDHIGVVYLSCAKKPNADGYQIQIYDGKKQVTSVISRKNKNIRIMNSKLNNLRFFKVKIRAYVSVNEKRKYGSWSQWSYFSQ